MFTSVFISALCSISSLLTGVVMICGVDRRGVVVEVVTVVEACREGEVGASGTCWENGVTVLNLCF